MGFVVVFESAFVVDMQVCSELLELVQEMKQYLCDKFEVDQYKELY